MQNYQTFLGLAERFYDDAEAKIDILASHTPNPAQIQDYFETLYPPTPLEEYLQTLA